ERRQLTTVLAGPRLAGPSSGMERVHMLSLFMALGDIATDFQFGAVTGCTVLFPYIDEGVLRAALQVKPEQRYYYSGWSKPLLKLALQERTGIEFVSRPKRAGGFYENLCEWMREGVLRDMTQAIERPAYVDLKSFRQKIERPDWSTWNL